MRRFRIDASKKITASDSYICDFSEGKFDSSDIGKSFILTKPFVASAGMQELDEENEEYFGEDAPKYFKDNNGYVDFIIPKGTKITITNTERYGFEIEFDGYQAYVCYDDCDKVMECVTASTKVQAGPVDFDDLDNAFKSSRRGPKAVAKELENGKSEIISYAQSKIKPVVDSLNSDIQNIVSKYILEDDIEAFDASFEGECDGSTVLTVPLNTSTIAGFDFTILDYGSFGAQLDPSESFAGEDIYLEFCDSHTGGPRTMGDLEDDSITLSCTNYAKYSNKGNIPVVDEPYYNSLYNAFKLLLTKKCYYEQFDAGEAVTVAERLIDMLAENADKYLSSIITRKTKEFLAQRGEVDEE